MNLIPTIDDRMLKLLDNVYWCENCGKTFKAKKEYKSHLNIFHP